MMKETMLMTAMTIIDFRVPNGGVLDLSGGEGDYKQITITHQVSIGF